LRHQTFQDETFLLCILVTVAQGDDITLLACNGYDFHAHAGEEGVAELRDDDGQKAAALSLDAAGSGVLDVADFLGGLQNALPQFGTQIAFPVAEYVGDGGDRSPGFQGDILDRDRLPRLSGNGIRHGLPMDMETFTC
jgi:hypothetical protein